MYSFIMGNKKITFSIVILFGIVGMFYTLIPISTKVTPDGFDQNELCSTDTPDPSTIPFNTNNSNLVISTVSNISSFSLASLNSSTLTDDNITSNISVPTKIFLMETSGKNFLNARQACAVESAARGNPNMQVIVYFVTPSLDNSNREMLKLAEIANVEFQYLNLDNYFKCSLLSSWYLKRDWNHSPFKISHMSDALRFLTLYKYGGIYLDLDVVIIKSLADLRNCAGKESNKIVAPGVMSFDKGHEFLYECLKEFAKTYSGGNWGWNGPHLITRVLKRACGGIKNLDNVNRQNCNGVTVLPSNAFYALQWQNWKDFFDAAKTESAMKKFEDSYLIHVWNKHSSKTPVKVGSGQAYDVVAKKYCPSIYAIQENTF